MSVASFIFSCNSETRESETADSITSNDQSSAEIPVNPLKEAYFGETHLHTSASMDAFIGGNRVSPAFEH